MPRSRVMLAIAVCGGLTLTGCGRTGQDGAQANGATLAAGAAKGTVTIWAQGAEAERLPSLLKKFKVKNPDVTVKVSSIPWGTAHDKYQTAIAAGTTPDIGQIGTTWMGEFGKAGAFAPTPSNFGAETFYPGSVESTKVGGAILGIPWYVDTPVLYYRTDLARKAGFTTAPRNWDDLKKLAKALQTKAGAKYGIGLPPKDFQAFLPFAWSNGARLTTADGSGWTLDTPQLRQAVAQYQSYFAEGIADKTPNTDTGAVESSFVNGSVPMFIGGAYEVGQLNQAGGAGFADKYATAVVPGPVSHTSFVGGGDLTVFKHSKNPTAAWKVLQFLSEPATQVEWYRMTGDLPSVQRAWDDPAFADDTKLAVFGRQLKDVASPPNTPQWSQVQAAGDAQMERVTTAGLTPAEALKTLQSEADAINARS
ncbi:sugar ABC transporter substrate-binding protein [Streptomyces sp. 142MFCol3.1]|uniref:sugar ABC transporter substrate-binding protein n=1 Tax=Streptomyces sp. 142MFCol3.1 TaxID=1172179 RepID=UPI00048FD154|nr:sugar ABC transporter substrate-binding protein [Streptomyces sp. 142MFCol3.1]